MLRPRSLIFVLALSALLALPAGIVLASHQFDDVPTESSIHDDVEAIAAAGVTTGCGDGNYCPADPVTRGQMAQFLNRLGALNGQDPVVNADRVDGYQANELVRVASAAKNALGPDLTPTPLNYLEVEIDAPVAGWLHVTGAVTVREQACTMACLVSAELRTTPMNNISYDVDEWIDDQSTLAITQVFFVEPGTNWVQLWLSRPVKEDGLTNGANGQLSVLFVPFDGSGGTVPAP